MELNALGNAIREYRAPMLDDLVALEARWYEGALPVHRLGEMRFFNLPPWTTKTPSRMFADLAGTRTIAGNQPEFRGFRTTVERPIAVGADLTGPLCLLEG